jgi:hypothetical protein
MLNRACKECGELVELRITRDQTRKFFCSAACRSTYYGKRKDMAPMWAKVNLPEVNARKGRPGPTKPNWVPVGGTALTSHGYVRVKVAYDKWEYEHRLVAQTDAEQVTHHKNRIKTDNRRENLETMSNVDHLDLHRRERRA